MNKLHDKDVFKYTANRPGFRWRKFPLRTAFTWFCIGGCPFVSALSVKARIDEFFRLVSQSNAFASTSFLLSLTPAAWYLWILYQPKYTSADAEWDKFINSGLTTGLSASLPPDISQRLENKLPVLPETSEANKWVQDLKIQFQSPVTLSFQGATQSRRFSTNFEYAVFASLSEALVGNDQITVSDSLMSVGRVMIHGKPYSCVFRQPNPDVMIIFLFRTEVVGSIASVICGGTHLIRRAKATGWAKRYGLSDDDVAGCPAWEVLMFLAALIIPGTSAVAVFFSAALFLLFILLKPIELIFEPKSPVQLNSWASVSGLIMKSDIAPDRSSVLAELDYMTRMVQNEVLRDVYTDLGCSAEDSGGATQQYWENNPKPSGDFL